MSDSLAGATKGMEAPAKGQTHHPTAALGHQAVHAVSRFIQEVRQMPGADHQKIDEGVATLQKGLQELLSGVGKGEAKEG